MNRICKQTDQQHHVSTKVIFVVFINFIFGCTTTSKFDGNLKEISSGQCIYEYINGDKLSGSCIKDENNNYNWKDGKERIYTDFSGKIIGKYSSTLNAIVLYSEKGDNPLYCISGDCWNGTGKTLLNTSGYYYDYFHDYFSREKNFLYDGKFKEASPTVGNLTLENSNKILYILNNGEITPTKAGKLAENRYDKQKLKEEREYETEIKHSKSTCDQYISSICSYYKNPFGGGTDRASMKVCIDSIKRGNAQDCTNACKDKYDVPYDRPISANATEVADCEKKCKRCM